MISRSFARYLAGLLLALVVLSSCSREPNDPLDAYLWQFEQKTAVLFEHLANGDELIKVEAGAASDMGMLSEDVEVYRYMRIASAANEVITHFAAPPLTLLQALNESPADPAWVARLENSVAEARATLKDRIATFKARMPVDPASPSQEGPVGELMVAGCGRGGIYSASDACKIGRYGYDDEGALYFYIWHNRQLQQLMIERILDLDVTDWVRSVEAAARGRG